MAQKQSRAFLGTGLAFPPQLNSRGEIALVSGERDIEQSIWIILGTRPGERVMRPTFGCRAYELLFEPIDPTTATLLKEYVMEALEFWEPRIQVRGVESYIDPKNDGVVLAEIHYEIKETHDVRSIVYPFYIANEDQAGEAA